MRHLVDIHYLPFFFLVFFDFEVPLTGTSVTSGITGDAELYMFAGGGG